MFEKYCIDEVVEDGEMIAVPWVGCSLFAVRSYDTRYHIPSYGS
jgi:hypothetical protein